MVSVSFFPDASSGPRSVLKPCNIRFSAIFFRRFFSLLFLVIIPYIPSPFLPRPPHLLIPSPTSAHLLPLPCPLALLPLPPSPTPPPPPSPDPPPHSPQFPPSFQRIRHGLFVKQLLGCCRGRKSFSIVLHIEEVL